MTNHETPSDLQGFRRTEAGYFAALVLLRAEPLLEAGLKPVFKHGEAREAQRTACPDRLDSRGERSISDFAGGGVESRHANRGQSACATQAGGQGLVTGRPGEQSRNLRYEGEPSTPRRSSDRPASNSIQGKGRWT